MRSRDCRSDLAPMGEGKALSAGEVEGKTESSLYLLGMFFCCSWHEQHRLRSFPGDEPKEIFFFSKNLS